MICPNHHLSFSYPPRSAPTSPHIQIHVFYLYLFRIHRKIEKNLKTILKIKTYKKYAHSDRHALNKPCKHKLRNCNIQANDQ